MNRENFNIFSLIGNVSKINEIKEQSNGTKYRYISICQNNKYKNKDEEIIDQANFFDIKIYEGSFKEFENLEIGQYLNVFGKIKVYKDKDNKTTLALVGNTCRRLTKKKDVEIFDYDWLNDDEEVDL
jgi:single-stranded DNA-binding protein